jgi:hypothetical protein
MPKVLSHKMELVLKIVKQPKEVTKTKMNTRTKRSRLAFALSAN